MTQVSLDEIQTGSEYDLISLYQDTEDDAIEKDSPFQYSLNSCEYYEPERFRDMINADNMHNNNVSSYFHLNCRGLSANWDAFYNLVCDLKNDKFSFDFIGISECFKTKDDTRLSLPGYHPLISRSRENSHRGGVGLFMDIKDNINFTIRNDISIFIPHIFESVFIEVDNPSSKNSIIGIIYRPNTDPHADLDISENNLCEPMNIINREQKHSIIMGDINIDLL